MCCNLFSIQKEKQYFVYFLFLVDNVSHSYRSIPQCLPVSFNDDQEEICKITHEVEYLPTYPYLEIKTISNTCKTKNQKRLAT